MKVASLHSGHPDGRLVVVSDDLTMQWLAAEHALSDALWQGHCHATEPVLPFDSSQCMAPLPRSPNFLDGSAYVNHVELVRRARGAEMPESFWTDPLMYQGLSVFAPAHAPIRGREDWGIDFEAEVAVITREVPMGVTSQDAPGYIAYVMLLNDISLRNLIPPELAKGFGFVQSKPISACSPVAVTPDALPGWDGRKLNGVLKVDLNGVPFGRANAGVDMTFDFGDLIAHAARTRDLPFGTVIGSGTVSNKGVDGPGRPISDGGVGYSCIAEQRTVETILSGAPRTRFLGNGDHVDIWMEDADRRSIFGSISQKVETI